jgi:tetratricopeptide (TPR) repeat protein
MLALCAFEQGLETDPEHRATLISKASVLSERLGRDGDALAVMDHLVGLYPEYAEGISSRGVLRARLGKRKKALEDARRALELTRDAFVVYQVGDIYALTSRQERDNADQALLLLHEALRKGFGARELPTDPDLKPLHSHPEFRRLLDLAEHLRKAPHVQSRPQDSGNNPR